MRRWLIAGGVATVGAIAAVGVAFGARDGDTREPAPTPDAANVNVATVTRRDLARAEELDGTVGFGAASPLVLALAGTLTSLPTAGDVIKEGTVVATIDGQPVVALAGGTPLWRDLGPGAADGADVLAVEQALQRLGFTAEYDVTVDGDWTDATTRAVKAFQDHFGQDDDGEITLGEVVMVDAPLRVAAVSGTPGQQSSEAAIDVSGTAQIVSVDLDVADASLVAAGDEVTVELPDGTTAAATVTSIGEASTGEDGATTLPVTITLAGGTDLPPGSPVDVLVTVVAAEDALSVPVEAVLALAEGGYAVEVRNGAATDLVGVDLGTFADGFVEITGDVAEGAEVVVP
jgi:peptidoglycan hydrolase-like protein with peptidoglycan-binding domain